MVYRDILVTKFLIFLQVIALLELAYSGQLGSLGQEEGGHWLCLFFRCYIHFFSFSSADLGVESWACCTLGKH